MVIEIPDQVSQHGASCWNHFLAAGVPVRRLEALGAYAILQHRDVVKHVALANTTPFARRRSPPRRLGRHEEDGTHCGLRDGLVPPALQKAISPCQDVGVDSTPPCAPASQPNPHDSANAPSRDGRHSCRGGAIGCQRRRCHRRCRCAQHVMRLAFAALASVRLGIPIGSTERMIAARHTPLSPQVWP